MAFAVVNILCISFVAALNLHNIPSRSLDHMYLEMTLSLGKYYEYYYATFLERNSEASWWSVLVSIICSYLSYYVCCCLFQT